MKKPSKSAKAFSLKSKKDLAGYPLYPPSEDIYNKDKETELNPENLSEIKVLPEKQGKRNEKNFGEVLTGDDLDVPGDELDDQLENIGSEDEENNYYSIGGDKGD